MKNKNTIWWIIGLLIFFGIAAIVYFSFTIRMIGTWILIAFGLSTVATIIYSFTGAFCKKTSHKCILTAIIITLSIFGYLKYKEGPSVVQMKEDVLYIHPKSQTLSNDEVYDGSKNDPNLKQDTTK